jgi:hypothetical protein
MTRDEMLGRAAEIEKHFGKFGEVAELCSPVRALLAAQTWQPIETAPKDGTWIQVCWAMYLTGPQEGGQFLPISVQWSQFHPNAPGKACWRDRNGHKIEGRTHWMHLPVSP